MNINKNAVLFHWMDERMRNIHPSTVYKKGRTDVSILAYCFCNDEGFDASFKPVECAIRETWLQCGLMNTILVVNKQHACVEKFAEDFSPWIKIHVEPSLIPGRIETMSADCNGKLHTRFDTESVLIVQNDGFPLRSGLDDFVGKFDFIGAPYIRNTPWKQFVCSILGCRVSNGGFSLRSHRICEMAAFYWTKRYSTWEHSAHALSEDIFYTKTLPLHERRYRNSITIAPFQDSITFSIDSIIPIDIPATLPFGFHGGNTFEKLISLI